MNYKNEWLTACFSGTPDRTYDVTAHYHGQSETKGPYSLAVAQDLAEEYKARKCEVYITDADTGEIVA